MRRKSIILLVMILLLFPSITLAESSGVLNEEPPNTQVEFILLTKSESKNISHAVISSSGNRVVYVVEESTGASIFVVNSDGSDESLLFESGKLTDPKNSNIHFRLQSTCTPTISGDGNTVAFSVEELPGEEIGRYLLIYNFSRTDWQGPEIVDFKDLSKKDYDYDVYIIGTPSISYDGSVIVTAISFKYFDIWDSCIVKTDKSGAGPFSILHFDSFKYTLGGDPVVSGNGEKVIFCGRKEDDYNSPYVLYLMNSDGSSLKNISPTGTILGRYGGGEYHISTAGNTVGLRCEDINDPDTVQYRIINTLDSSVIATVKNYEGDSVYSRIFGRPQMIDDGNKVVYISSNSYLEINKVYIKNITNDGDLTLLNDKTENLPWEYTYVNVAGSTLSSSIGTTRYMDSKGTKFLVKKGMDNWNSENLYVIKIKGKKKPPISTGFQLQWTDIDEKYYIDLKDCFIKFDENSISFKITTYREWKNWREDLWIAIYFNKDKDTSTGRPNSVGGNGEDLIAVIGNDGGILSYSIYEWKSGGFQKVGELENYEIENNSSEAVMTMLREFLNEDFEYWVGIMDNVNNEFDYYPNDDQDYYAYFEFEEKEFPSSIEVLYPNGGESFNAGDTVKVKWNSSNLTKGKIRIYLFDGEGWNLIASNLSINDNSYTWTVPEVSSQECKIRIENYDPKSNLWILRDESDGYFSILSPLSGNITVKATLDGKEWKGSINYTISGPENLYGDSVPKDFYSVSTGKYAISYISGGPEKACLSSITPQKTQTLDKGKTIIFTLNFKSEEEFNPPSPPKNLSLKIVKNGILLKWDHSKPGSNLVGGYNIYRSIISQEGFIKITSVKATENTYLDEDVEIGETYYYMVKAFDIRENESEASDEVKITISEEYISPFNLKAYPGDEKVYLEWTPPNFQKDLKGYYIYRSKVSGEYSEIPINQSPVLTNYYTDNGLENGVLYFYVCKAVYKDGTISSVLQEVSVIPKELFITVDITDGEIVDNEKFTFSGSVDPNSIVLINGKEIKVEENGKFTATVNLSPGDNIITITVKNKAGDAVKIKKKVILRTQSEEIEIKLQIGNTTILVNNIPVQIDVPPTIVEGRTLLPIRWVAEPLGAEVGWNGKERKVTVSLNDTIVELWIGKSIARVNGIEKPIDPNNPKVKPIIIKGRTMLPVRFIAENLGCKVEWDGATKTVTIIYRKSP